jgi:alpha-L-fucosidase 2
VPPNKTKNMRRIYLLTLIVFLTFLSIEGNAQSKHKLWYDKAAQHFEESLPLGNGKMGACVFGGVLSEKIYLNDATLWSGEPVDPYMNPDAHKFIPEIREALADENYKLADKLNQNIQGKFSQSFAPLGTLNIKFENDGEGSGYYRELDINQAIASVQYSNNEVEFTREYFVSHPDKVMIIKLDADQKKMLNFELSFESLLKYAIKPDGKCFKIDGYAPYHAEPNYRGDIPNAIRFDKDRGTRFSTYIHIETKGETEYTENSIKVNDAKEAIIYISVATSFNGFDKDPAKEGKDNKAIAGLQLKNAVAKGYKKIKKDHIKDYQNFYRRLSLDLGPTTAPDLPTDERLKRYTEGAEDKNLEVLYFQYGRYLLISSSRTPEVPANLQGIWNPYMRPPWSSNYTMNINVEENYWLAEIANLSELHKPFLGFIKNLATTGEVTAKTFYGVDKGWAACHNSDIWAMSNPVGDFGNGHPVWACWNMSGTWAVTHLWEHYLFTRDEDFLREEAYPLMKGAAEFCMNWVVQDEDGYYYTSPSTSPENLYLTPDGYAGATFYGAASDIGMIRECLKATLDACIILADDSEFEKELTHVLNNLIRYKVGEKGNLQEWFHDWEDADPQHRHQSQLFGLFPGHHIKPDISLGLAEASRKTLEIKGDETTGWSKGWRINLWARLNDGNRAYKMYRELLSYVEPDNAKKTKYSGGGGTYPNLFDAHPPFQIDGNFGGAAGVLEMLIYSVDERITLLPALPDEWSEGSVNGVVARGGHVLDIKWKDGKLTEVKVRTKTGEYCILVYKDKMAHLDTEIGVEYTFDGNLKKK